MTRKRYFISSRKPFPRYWISNL